MVETNLIGYSQVYNNVQRKEKWLYLLPDNTNWARLEKARSHQSLSPSKEWENRFTSRIRQRQNRPLIIIFRIREACLSHQHTATCFSCSCNRWKQFCQFLVKFHSNLSFHISHHNMDTLCGFTALLTSLNIVRIHPMPCVPNSYICCFCLRTFCYICSRLQHYTGPLLKSWCVCACGCVWVWEMDWSW